MQINRSPGGVPKLPVAEIIVSARGLDGDDWAHPKFHGGPQQAVLLIALEVIEFLKSEGHHVFPGALGENFTVQGLDHRRWRSGQRFRAGGVLLELTKLRQPCSALNPYGKGIQARLYDERCKNGDPESPVWARGGFYASVIEPGTVRSGDIISLED